jgi:hypothetical protein
MTIGRFERMVSMPEDEYLHLKSLKHVQNPIENKFMSLSSDYKKQDSIPNPHMRIQRQGETLNEMMKLKDDLRNRFIEATPKPYQSRAQSLFKFIGDNMSINNKGELLDDGKAIEGSNIGDLVQHAVRDRRRNIIPDGWKEFLKILRANNAPRMIMNYETLEELHGSPKIIATPKLKASHSPLAKTSKIPLPKASKIPISVSSKKPFIFNIKTESKENIHSSAIDKRKRKTPIKRLLGQSESHIAMPFIKEDIKLHIKQDKSDEKYLPVANTTSRGKRPRKKPAYFRDYES